MENCDISWLGNRFTGAELSSMEKEMDNSWLYLNPYKMTEAAKKINITILGICLDPPFVKPFADMAIVFEYNDIFEKSWIHIGKEFFEEVLKDLGLWDKYHW